GVPPDSSRASRTWFQELAAGQPLVITRETGSPYSQEPAVLAAVRALAPDGRFDGAFAAVIRLNSLEPSVTDPILPAHSEVALADANGHFITETNPRAFTGLPADWRARTRAQGSDVWYARGANGERR